MKKILFLLLIAGCKSASDNPAPVTVAPKTEQAIVKYVSVGTDPYYPKCLYQLKLLSSNRVLTIEDDKKKWHTGQTFTVSIP